jgi:hypothetical protein
MSITNSKAYLTNKTSNVYELTDFTIPANGTVLFWDTQTQPVNQAAFNNLEKVSANNGDIRALIDDGYVLFSQDGLDLNSEQFMSMISLMMYSYKESKTITSLMSTALKTDSLKEDDGRQLVTTTPIGVGWNVFFTGFDDDEAQFEIYKLNPFAPSGRGEGRPFLVEIDGALPDPSTEEFSFSEPVHIHDGEVNWGPEGAWAHTDHFSIGIRFTATVVTVTPGVGNCNLVSLLTGTPVTESYGMEIIVPAAGDGYFTVNLATACPIRSTQRTGYWNVEEGMGSISVGNPGVSLFNLYTFAPADAWVMKRIATANSRRIMEPDVYRTELIHPAWKVILSVTKTSAGVGWLTGWFTVFRKNVQ